MRATVMYGAGDVRVENVPDPTIKEPTVLDGSIDPGRVFDRTVRLDEVPDGYQAMADREALKVLIVP